MKKTNFYNTDVVLYVMLTLQVLLWTQTKQYLPDFTIVPEVPSKQTVAAMSLGDEEFYFRSLAYTLQNSGDTFGRFTALYKYDYKKLYNWFKVLDTLDSKSNFIPSLASYYYSQTQYKPDVIYIVKYLDEHASKDLYNKWWWMSQAIYLANHKLQDSDLALTLAKKLASTPRDDVPLWVKQMPAFIHEKRGEEEEALIIIENILKNIENIDQGELNFMQYFVFERLQKLAKDNPNIVKKHPSLKKLLEHKKD